MKFKSTGKFTVPKWPPDHYWVTMVAGGKGGADKEYKRILVPLETAIRLGWKDPMKAMG